MLTDITKIELSFTPEIRALMGEWLTHAAFEMPREMYYDRTGENLSLRDFFLKGAFDRNLGCMFNLTDEYGGQENAPLEIYTAGLLLNHKIVGGAQRVENCYNYKPIVSYDEIVDTFLENLDPENNPISPYFAYFSSGQTNFEDEAFIFDEGCWPLIEAMTIEGFILHKNQQYYWTEKIRPLFEYMNVWKSRELAKQMSLEEGHFHQKIEKSLTEGGPLEALKTILNHPEINLADKVTEANTKALLNCLDLSASRKNISEIKQKPKLQWHGE